MDEQENVDDIEHVETSSIARQSTRLIRFVNNLCSGCLSCLSLTRYLCILLGTIFVLLLPIFVITVNAIHWRSMVHSSSSWTSTSFSSNYDSIGDMNNILFGLIALSGAIATFCSFGWKSFLESLNNCCCNWPATAVHGMESFCTRYIPRRVSEIVRSILRPVFQWFTANQFGTALDEGIV